MEKRNYLKPETVNYPILQSESFIAASFIIDEETGTEETLTTGYFQPNCFEGISEAKALFGQADNNPGVRQGPVKVCTNQNVANCISTLDFKKGHTTYFYITNIGTDQYKLEYQVSTEKDC